MKLNILGRTRQRGEPFLFLFFILCKYIVWLWPFYNLYNHISISLVFILNIVCNKDVCGDENLAPNDNCSVGNSAADVITTPTKKKVFQSRIPKYQFSPKLQTKN